MERKFTRKVKVGSVYVGGDSPVSIQSMTNTDTRNVEATLDQIRALHVAGCEIIRCAVPDMKAAEAIIRINPGNIGSVDRVKAVTEACKAKNIPIRIGVNSGSLEKDILERDGKPTAKGLVESALRHVKILEELEFYDIVISIKSSDVPMMIEAYRLMSSKCNYPLHLGVTESGTVFRGTIKSTLGIGTLLAEGIGDTIRVSLTSDPIEEIKVAKEMLIALGLRKQGMTFVSCPTCGRTQINLIKIAEEVEKRLENCNKNIKVAVMGCVVNGPGEAREADIGIAGGKGEGLIFKKGEIIKKVKEEDLIEELMKEIEKL